MKLPKDSELFDNSTIFQRFSYDILTKESFQIFGSLDVDRAIEPPIWRQGGGNEMGLDLLKIKDVARR